MPWQQHVADVALEIDPATGNLAYREVWLTIPRQSGKTTLILPVVVLRSAISKYLGGRQRMLYAAQTRNDARSKWEEDFVEDLKAARKMRGKFAVKLQTGSEHVRFLDRSTFGPIATTEKAGHGKTLDLGCLDEVFAQTDDRVEQAWRPAMLTRANAQFWGVSTAGTLEASHYLLSKVKAGRRIVEGGSTGRIAYFEWSAEDDADPESPATWRSCMPALGFTVTEDTIRAELESAVSGNNLNLFLRAYLNRWVDRDLGEQVIPASAWAACRDEESELAGEPAFAFDVTPLGSTAAIAVAGQRADGSMHVEVVDYRPGAGTDWLRTRLPELASRWSSLPVAYDPAGPAGEMRAELEAAGVILKPMSSRDLAQAAGGLLTAVTQEPRRLAHIGQPQLDAAVAAGRKRDLGDAWAWRRRTSAADISPLVAITAARWNRLAHVQITSANVYVV
jgi:phage terminase large subunit-like protein